MRQCNVFSSIVFVQSFNESFKITTSNWTLTLISFRLQFHPIDNDSNYKRGGRVVEVARLRSLPKVNRATLDRRTPGIGMSFHTAILINLKHSHLLEWGSIFLFPVLRVYHWSKKICWMMQSSEHCTSALNPPAEVS